MPELTEVHLPRASDARRDMRYGQRWTAAQSAKNWFLYQSIRLSLAVLDRLKERTLLAIGRLAGDIAYIGAPRARRRALLRAQAVLGRSINGAFVRRCFRRAGENLALCLMMRRANLRASQFISVDDAARRTLCAAVAEGKGVVVVSAHFGPFELLAARVAELGLEPAIVVRESYDPRLDAVVDAHRDRQGVQVIHRGKSGASARTLRALRLGRPVGFLIDLPARVRSTSLTFLGTQTLVALGPQRLCQLTGARLLVATLQRRSREEHPLPHFNLRMTPVELETAERDNIVALTRRVSQQLERDIVDSPEDWLWMAK